MTTASIFVTVPTTTTTTPFLSINKTKRSSLSRLKLEALNLVQVCWVLLQVAPQADRVLIRLEDLPEKSSGGVLLSKSAVKFERYLMGEVLSVGAGEVEAGKRVLFSDINIAYEVDLGTDAKHCFCKAGDLLAVVE
ncbi:hypothetical protein Peur_047838 [Populus x canadensis]